MKLFKRTKTPEASWYVSFMVARRQYMWSTKTNDKVLALRRAKDYRQKVVAKSYGLVDAMKQGGGLPTIADLITAYLALPSPKEKTRKRNVHALRVLLKASRVSEKDRVSALSRGVIKTYQKYCESEGVSPFTRNGIIQQARSLLSKRAMDYYEETKNAIPYDVVRPFMAVALDRLPKGNIVLPSNEAVSKASNELTGPHRRAFLLARFAGLRSGEICEARRSWLAENILTVDANIAKSKRSRQIALPLEVLAELLLSDDPVYLVGHNRFKVVQREIPKMLSKLGFPGAKPLHAVRALFGSIIYTTQGGAQAKTALGHASIATTEAHYAMNMSMPAPIPFAS